jgi:hypothetical protein
MLSLLSAGTGSLFTILIVVLIVVVVLAIIRRV